MQTIDLRQEAKTIWDIVQDGIKRKTIIVGESTRFLDLIDTPDSYTGQSDNLLSVSTDETGIEFVSISSLDTRAKVSANDTTAGYFSTKLVAGTGITLTVDNPSGNETLTVATTITQYDNEMAQDSVGGILTDTATIDFTYSDVANTITADVKTNSISNALFRQSAALSVVGNGTNSTANVDDIAAASDHQVLRRSGTAIAFGAIALDQAAAVTGTLPVGKGGTGLSTIAAGSILAANTLDTLTAITSTTGLKVLKNDTGVTSWNTTTGTGNSVMATNPVFPGYIDITAIANPAAPAAGIVRVHALTTQGFSRLEQDSEATTNITLGRDNVFIVKNDSGGALVKGETVYVFDSASGVPSVKKARANSVNTLPAVGVVLDNFADGAFGQVMKTGILSGFDTHDYTAGDTLYVSATTAGALTTTRPAYSNLVQRIGTVLVSNVNGLVLIVTAPFVGGMETGTTATTYTFGGAVIWGTDNTHDIGASSATRPKDLYLGGAVKQGAWNATTIGVPYGGTGLTSLNQGDILYASAANTLAALAKNATATRYLSNTGATNNPAWAQIDLTNGVTGALPIGNGGTGQTTANAALNALLPTQTGHAGEFLKTDGADTSWGSPGGSGTVNSGGAGQLAYYPSAATLVDDLAFGTANQVLGMTAAGTGYEHKTMTEGEGIDIAHAANAITISAEDATTTNKGISELATDAETLTGTDTGRTITPSNLEYARSVSGWTPISGTFTYASAATINVASGAASIYQIGDKLRYQNNDSGTWLYAYITTVADTLLTVKGDAVPNATLTDMGYSHVENPLGFPHVFAYTPTWVADSGANPAIGNGSLTGYFSMSGNKVYFWARMLAGNTTTFGTAANWRIGIPITASSTVGNQVSVSAYYLDSGTSERAGFGARIVSGASYLAVAGEGTGYWDSGTPITWAVNDIWIVEGFYLI